MARSTVAAAIRIAYCAGREGANMRRAKSLVCAAYLTGSTSAIVAASTASTLFFCAGAASAQSAINHVADVRLRADDTVLGGAAIEVVGSAAPNYNVRLADAGRRVLIDLSNADVAGAPAALTSGVGVVGGVLTQAFPSSTGTMTRLTVSLQAESTYRVVPDGTSLRVIFAPRVPYVAPTASPTAAAAPAATSMAPPHAVGVAPPSPVTAANSPPVVTVASSPPVTAAASPPVVTVASPPVVTASPSAVAKIVVRDIRFERAPATVSGCAPYGCDRVSLDVGRIPTYSLSTTLEGRLRLELKGTLLSDALARTLDVTAYRGALKSVTASHDAAAGTTVLEIDRASDTTGTVSAEDGALVWSFLVPKPNLPAPPLAQIHLDRDALGKDGGVVRRIVTVAREAAPPDVPRIETSIHDEDPVVETSGGGAAGFASNPAGLAQTRYNGRRIDIDLKDADVHNVLRLLADTGHVNIVTADDVAGTITIRMRNVPWDQVLDVVLQAKGLGMVRQGNLIRVALLAQLQKEREFRLAQQKQEYELTPLETRLIPISYAQADELQARAKDLLSPRGSLAVDERTNVLIARDVSANLNYIEELIRSLDTQTAQVLIEARIVEGTSNYLRDVGIQWGGDVTFGPATGNPTGIAFPNSASAAGGNYDNNTPTAGLSPFTRNIATPNFAVNLPAAVGTGAGGALGMTFGSIDNTLNLGVRLSAAEQSGLVRIVSAPRILVLDNREARINQGTLIPYAQVSALGVQTTFQEAKLQLLVRPHVTAEGSVSMHVKLNRDEPDFNQTAPNGAPTILKREAETDLLVMDGHTAVIGGIYTRNTGRNLSQVPFFGDIPILGLLFQRRQANDARGELIIFITPHIVNRAEALGR